MRTVDYIDVLNGTAGRCNLALDLASGDEFTTLRTFHSDRLAKIWEWHAWTDLLRIEKRYWRDLWNETDSYAAGSLTAAVEVYDPDSAEYYQSLKGTNLNHAPTVSGAVNGEWWAVAAPDYSAEDYNAGTTYARGDQAYDPVTDRVYQLHAASALGNSPTDTDFWGVLTPFNRYVAYEQTGRTAFDHVLNVWDKDPRSNRDAARVAHFRSSDGVQILENRAYVWIQLRLRCPQLTGDVYSASAAYASGVQKFYSSATLRGNFYTTNQSTSAGQSPDTHAAKWSKVEIPLFARRYLIHGGAADWLRPEEKESEADRQEILGEAALGEEVMKITGQAGQTETAEVRVR